MQRFLFSALAMACHAPPEAPGGAAFQGFTPAPGGQPANAKPADKKKSQAASPPGATGDALSAPQAAAAPGGEPAPAEGAAAQAPAPRRRGRPPRDPNAPATQGESRGPSEQKVTLSAAIDILTGMTTADKEPLLKYMGEFQAMPKAQAQRLAAALGKIFAS